MLTFRNVNQKEKSFGVGMGTQRGDKSVKKSRVPLTFVERGQLLRYVWKILGWAFHYLVGSGPVLGRCPCH